MEPIQLYSLNSAANFLLIIAKKLSTITFSEQIYYLGTGTLVPPIWMNFWKTSKRGGGSHFRSKKLLQIFAVFCHKEDEEGDKGDEV